MADSDKVWVGYAIGIVAIIALVWACVAIGDTPKAEWLNGLLLLFGGLLGWVTGILASPKNSKEKSQFATYGAAISTFISGFVLAKLDKLFELECAQACVTLATFGPALIFGSAFLLGTLFTFVGRRYLKM